MICKNKLIFILFINILLSSAHLFADSKTVVAVSTGAYPPYYSKEMKNYGFIAEIVKEAFKRSGYNVEFLFVPWKRALMATQDGKYDALFTIWHRKEREKWFLFSSPLPSNTLVFFAMKKRSISFQKYIDLQKYRIGVVRGYSIPIKFEKLGIYLEEVTNNFQNMKKLIHGRVDLIVIDKLLGLHLIHTKHPEYKDEIEWLKPVIKEELQYLVISKKAKNSKNKINAFNAGLKEIKLDGTFEKILGDLLRK